ELEKQITYWREKLTGPIPTLEIPTDHSRPAVQSFRGARHLFKIPSSVAEKVKALGHQENVTLYMVLLTAFKLLLYRYTGQTDLAIGSPSANRSHAQIEGLIGFFVNTLVLRSDLSNNPTARDLLRQVRRIALEAYQAQEVPFEKVVEIVQPERNLSYNPLFQIMFALETVEPAMVLSDLSTQLIEVDNSTSKFDLTLFIRESEQGLAGVIEYNTDLFEVGTITRLAGHFNTILESLGTGNLDQTINQIPLLTTTEQHQLFVEWNETQTSYPTNTQCIHNLFEAQAKRTPNAIALTFEEHSLTYQDLDERSNQLAHYLRALDVGVGSVVGLSIEYSVELIVALLGILKSGGAYTPLDPRYPPGRLERMVADANASILLTQARFLAQFSGSALQSVRIIALDESWAEISQESAASLTTGLATPDDLIYCLFTSGSTGKPKEAGVYHKSFTNLINWFIDDLSLTSKDSTLLISSPSFDLTQKNIYTPLVCGGTLHLIDMPMFDPYQIGQTIDLHDVTWVNCTPSTFYALLETVVDNSPSLASLRYVVLGGEPIIMARLYDWLASPHIQAKIVNTYGPTECTDICAAFIVETPEQFINKPVPLGRPVSNVQLYVLDQYLRPLPVGVVGELCIAGNGVGQGYLNDIKLTAEKFAPNPFVAMSNKQENRGSDQLT
ncbi:MAG: AMP-binding protein, partial [Chloroflexota bacterium]